MGYVARHFGDKTAASMGRLTWNPGSHIDPLGTILLPLALFFVSAGSILVGYAKPIPIDIRNLRNPKRDIVWVLLAKPAANFVQAWLWGVLGFVLPGLGITEPFLVEMCALGSFLNLMLMAFSLLPIPPMTGGQILANLLPYQQGQWLARIEPYGFYVVMGLALFGLLGPVWLRPVMSAAHAVLNLLLLPFA